MGCSLSSILPCWAGSSHAYRDVVPRPSNKSEASHREKGKDHGEKTAGPRTSQTSLEGVGKDKNLWHGRESAAKRVHRWAVGTEEGTKGGMGILEGVVFPTMANILGVLLFLRLPWIVGKAGILYGFLLVFICCCCTFVTALSLSAVATNGKIAGGGSYYLISRSLGPALGAGVGLCFYMANSIGAAMYFMGTVEAWEIAAPNAQIIGTGELNNIRVTGFCILGVALLVVAGGIKYVARLGTFFLFIVLLVILCMALGCFIGPGESGSPYTVESADVHGKVTALTLEWSGLSGTHLMDNFGADYGAEQKAFPLDTGTYSFISLMALWFPAVTGIMAGSNRSADLADPSGSIPKGTLFAQGFTSIVYLSFVVLYGAVAPRETLLDDKFFASSAAWPLKEIVIFGVMASTIGAGLTSLVSGTRLLSAIAADKTLPILRVFAVQQGKEPRLALLASGVLCACAIAIGELNAVAPVLTMFFLMCYTCVNMSCTVLEAVSDPNWRPSFRYHHWSISLVGAILCVWMMFAISAIIAMVAIVFCMVIFAYASFNSHKVKWGDGFQGLKFQIARNILQKLDASAHTKNWRPQLLVITEASLSEGGDRNGADQQEVLNVHEPSLLSFASQLKGGRGITILGGICCSKGVDFFGEDGMFVSQTHQRKVLDGQDSMQKLLKKYNIEGFGRMVYTEDYSNGLTSLMQICGLGAFQPNCVLAMWPRDWSGVGPEGMEKRSRLIRMVQVAVVFQKVMLITKGVFWPKLSDRLGGEIDVWWIVGDGGILLLLPFLLGKHRVWRDCRTRLFVLAEKVGDDPEQVRQETQNFVNDFRLNIEVNVQVVEHDIIMNDTLDGEDLAGADDEQGEGARGEDDGVPQRVRSGLSLNEGLASWRRQVSHDTITGKARANSGDEDGLGTRTRSGDSQTAGDTFGTWTRQESNPESLSSKHRLGGQVANLLRTASAEKAFPSHPPGTIGSVCSPKPTVADVFPEQTRSGSMEVERSRVLSEPVKAASNLFLSSSGLFMHHAGQLKSAKPCSSQQLGLARGLNRLMREKSSGADLVVTNLPDIPPEESAFGYFQLVSAMTRELPRCVLVRGTATEVITAFT